MITVQDDGFADLCRAFDLYWDEDGQRTSESADSDGQGEDTPDTDEGLSKSFIIVSGVGGSGYRSEPSREGGGNVAGEQDKDEEPSPFAFDIINRDLGDHKASENVRDSETPIGDLPEGRSCPHEPSREGVVGVINNNKDGELSPLARGGDPRGHEPFETTRDSDILADTLPEGSSFPHGPSSEWGGDVANYNKGKESSTPAPGGDPQGREPSETRDSKTSVGALPEGGSFPHEPSRGGGGDVAVGGTDEEPSPPAPGGDPQDHEPSGSIRDSETSAETLSEGSSFPHEPSREGGGDVVTKNKDEESSPPALRGDPQDHEPSESARNSVTSAGALPEGGSFPDEPSREEGGDVAIENKDEESSPPAPGGDSQDCEPPESIRDSEAPAEALPEGGSFPHEPSREGGGDVVNKNKDEESSPSAPGGDLQGHETSESIQAKEVPQQTKKYLDQLMTMVGLEQVKTHFLVVKAIVDAARRRGGEFLKKERFDLALLGNLGTGKKTIAELYAKFLASLGVVPTKEEALFQISGWSFQEGEINKFHEAGGRVIFFNHYSNEFFDVTEKFASKNFVFIVAGTETARFRTENPRARFIFRQVITLKDYTDDELLQILAGMIKERSMEVEGGVDGIYLRILIRRIGRSRGTTSFGNVHSLELEYNRFCYRQAERLQKQLGHPDGGKSDNSFLTKEDLIGAEPSDTRHESLAWRELQSMAGLEDVKAAVNELFGQANANYHRELQGEEPIEMTMNRVFLGPPGTGKTTAGKLYGQILADLGLVSKRDVVIKNPSNFIEPYLGQSELKTKEILKATQGKVLIIDDAHMLYNGSADRAGSDVFRVAIVDTLVAQITNQPGDDRCIILIGYPEQMREMFQKSNPGLQRRFPLEDSFQFQDYNTTQLSQIVDLKLTKYKLDATAEAKRVATEVLSKARDRPNFGNGGDVENLLSRAQTAHRERISTSPIKAPTNPGGIVLEPSDFDPDYGRGSHASENCQLLFKKLVGFENIIKQFQGYQQIAAGMRMHGFDPRPHIPFTFVFKGPPGTGKTTTARIVGNIFYDMGFLSTAEVIECSASDLISEYVGRTGPKVISLLERALGKVLFVDEAYRLGNGQFRSAVNEEAVGELVDCIEKPRYAKKMVIVLAGYGEDMESLLRVNRGLQGRFPTNVTFPYMEPPQCLHLLEKIIGEFRVEINYLGDTGGAKKAKVLRLFAKLSATRSWANGRDVETLARSIIGNVFKDQGSNINVALSLSVSIDDLIKSLQVVFRSRLRAERRRESKDA